MPKNLPVSVEPYMRSLSAELTSRTSRKKVA